MEQVNVNHTEEPQLYIYSPGLSLPVLTRCRTAAEHFIPSTCLSLSTDKVKGQPEEEFEKGGGVGRECPLFPQRVEVSLCVLVLVFVFKETRSEKQKVEGGGCFSFSELPRHVGALTCNASWVINPSRLMHHWSASWWKFFGDPVLKANQVKWKKETDNKNVIFLMHHSHCFLHRRTFICTYRLSFSHCGVIDGQLLLHGPTHLKVWQASAITACVWDAHDKTKNMDPHCCFICFIVAWLWCLNGLWDEEILGEPTSLQYSDIMMTLSSYW